MRVAPLHDAKKSASTVHELVTSEEVAAHFKPRCDKLSGDPIWTKCWHQFMELKKGQSFRCSIVKTERVKNPVTKKWVWKTQWVRHQKRFMSCKIEEFRAKVLKWEPYLTWRADYLAKNPRLPATWHVGIVRLYKEKCFCIDPVEEIRKCGCEYHLKMDELIAALKKWRRAVAIKVKRINPQHTCEVRVHANMYVCKYICLSACLTHMHLCRFVRLAMGFYKI